MTKILLPSLAVAALLIGPGCEQHPDSQTVPGFKGNEILNQELREKMARTPVTINPDAPKFFPSKKER